MTDRIAGSAAGSTLSQLSPTQQWAHDKKIERMKKMLSDRYHEIEVLDSTGSWKHIVGVHARKGVEGALLVRDMETGFWSPLDKDTWRHVRPPNE